MKLKEIERMARNQMPMPSEITIDEQKFYVIVRDIYRKYDQNEVDRNQAVIERNQARAALEKQVELNNMMSNMFNRIGANLQRSEELRYKINKEKNAEKKLELALECIRLLTGDELVGMK